jgi:hypothetical protein
MLKCIRMVLGETDCEGVNWIELDSGQCWTSVMWILAEGTSLNSWIALTCLEKILFHRVSYYFEY